jgi:hypothetical protein
MPTSQISYGVPYTTVGFNGTGSILGSNINSEAVVIKNGGGENIITFHKDGTIETSAGKINADEWVSLTLLLKQLIMDMSKDPDLVSKYPYIQDVAHGWLMKELKK